jgi:hypothetical protein
MLISALGLLLSAGSHLAALGGFPTPGGSLVWGLHIGIFVVWLPTVLVANRIARHGKRSDFWKLALSGCPTWARYALYGLFGYAVLNFIVGMGGVANHRKESGATSFEEVRLFSGHWMVFYGAALATLFSAINRPKLLKGSKCVQGHDVSPLDQFCPKCGTAVAHEPAEV